MPDRATLVFRAFAVAAAHETLRSDPRWADDEDWQRRQAARRFSYVRFLVGQGIVSDQESKHPQNPEGKRRNV